MFASFEHIIQNIRLHFNSIIMVIFDYSVTLVLDKVSKKGKYL